MLAALIFGGAFAEGERFFQPAVGFLPPGLAASQAVPVPIVPLAGDKLSFQFAESVPYSATNVREGSVPYYSSARTLSFAVCALAVAGAAVRSSLRLLSLHLAPGQPEFYRVEGGGTLRHAGG